MHIVVLLALLYSAPLVLAGRATSRPRAAHDHYYRPPTTHNHHCLPPPRARWWLAVRGTSSSARSELIGRGGFFFRPK